MNTQIRDTKNPIYLLNPTLFSTSMTAPPAESMQHVMQFELTEGCSWGNCTFCDMPKGSYKITTIEEYKRHVDEVWKAVKDKRNIERLFIGSENALSAKTSLLQEAITYSIKSFKENTQRLPRRITIYGNTRDILQKGKGYSNGVTDLDYLNCGGTCDGECSKDKFGSKIGLGYVYWGIESGDDKTLKYINKGYDQEDILEAGNLIKNSGLLKSVTIIPGLGGAKFADSHLEQTIKVLNLEKPNFVTFIGINPSPNTEYAKRMFQEVIEGKNRPLTKKELAEQTLSMLDGINFDTTAGCFGTEIQKFGYNPLPFGSIELSCWYKEEKRELVRKLKEKIANEEFF
jgi:radical SAM superfamily enzyme YgiQ (UPF0313 family)